MDGVSLHQDGGMMWHVASKTRDSCAPRLLHGELGPAEALLFDLCQCQVCLLLRAGLCQT